MRIKIPRNSEDLLGIDGVYPTEVPIGFYLLSYKHGISLPPETESPFIMELTALIVNGEITEDRYIELRE